MVALSTAEAEYIATSLAYYEVVWLRKIFNELFGHVLDTTVIIFDNHSGILLYENLVFHDRSKHRYQVPLYLGYGTSRSNKASSYWD